MKKTFTHNFAYIAHKLFIPSLVAAAAFAYPSQARSEHYTIDESSSLLLECAPPSAMFRIKSNDTSFVIDYTREAFRISSVQTVKQDNGEKRQVRSVCKGMEDLLPPFPIGALCSGTSPAEESKIKAALTTYRRDIKTLLSALCAE